MGELGIQAGQVRPIQAALDQEVVNVGIGIEIGDAQDAPAPPQAQANQGPAPSFGDKVKAFFQAFKESVSARSFSNFSEKVATHAQENAQNRANARLDRQDSELAQGKPVTFSSNSYSKANVFDHDFHTSSRNVSALMSEIKAEGNYKAIRDQKINEFVGSIGLVEVSNMDTTKLDLLATQLESEGRREKADFVRQLIETVNTEQTPEGIRARFERELGAEGGLPAPKLTLSNMTSQNGVAFLNSVQSDAKQFSSDIGQILSDIKGSDTKTVKTVILDVLRNSTAATQSSLDRDRLDMIEDIFAKNREDEKAAFVKLLSTTLQESTTLAKAKEFFSDLAEDAVKTQDGGTFLRLSSDNGAASIKKIVVAAGAHAIGSEAEVVASRLASRQDVETLNSELKNQGVRVRSKSPVSRQSA